MLDQFSKTNIDYSETKQVRINVSLLNRMLLARLTSDFLGVRNSRNRIVSEREITRSAGFEAVKFHSSENSTVSFHSSENSTTSVFPQDGKIIRVLDPKVNRSKVLNFYSTLFNF